MSRRACRSVAPLLEFHDVTKRFGQLHAVGPISLDISAGQLVALVGPNGSGKSTLLATAAGVLEPTEGEITIAVDVGVLANTDSKALDQVLVNLLENSIKYTPETSEVTIKAAVESKVVRISVADNGPGIPEEHHQRIFERFYRVDQARSREMGGTGLGLSIVKHLVDAHGGGVSCRSELSKGTRFTFTLPPS